MAKTHYYALLGDAAHVRGNRIDGPRLYDPLGGQIMQTSSESAAAVVNTVIFGGTSGARARVTGLLTSGKYVVETLLVGGLPKAFQAGETLTYDTGGTATCGNTVVPVVLPTGILDPTSYPLLDQAIPFLGDITLNTPVPNDGALGDTVWWDQSFQKAREITVAAGYTGTFAPGDRYSTSGGAAFTVLTTVASGSALRVSVIRVTGTLAVSDTITAVTAGATGAGTISVVGAAQDAGQWTTLYPMPNWNGTLSQQFPQAEITPKSEGTDGGGCGIGPARKFLRGMWDHHQLAEDSLDRGVRCMVVSTSDGYGTGNQDGGIIVQCLHVTGLAQTWTIGEEVVTASLFSAKVVWFTSNNLYLKQTNGVKITAGDLLVGVTSGTSCTAAAGLVGWQKGCTHYEEFMDQLTLARTRPGSLYASQVEEWAGVAVWAWETEISLYAPGLVPVGAVSIDDMTAAYAQFITDLRADLGRADLPITFLKPPATYQSTAVPLAAYLNQLVITQVETSQVGVSVATSNGWEQGTPAGMLTNTETYQVTYCRTQDYLDAGDRLWRALAFAQYVPPDGLMLPLPIILTSGQSQGVSFLNAGLYANTGVDFDPDLYSSATFPGVNTLDELVFMWNAKDTVLEWQNFDVSINGNTFAHYLGNTEGTFSGLHCALALRMKKRFGEDGASGEFGLINLNVGGSAAYGEAHIANGTWDPAAGPQDIRAVSVTVTPLSSPTRGRFTGAAGSFSGWEQSDRVNVTGSALGNLGAGGNSHVGGYAAVTTDVAADGSYIEIEGAFVTESTVTLTFTHGARRLWPDVQRQIRTALQKCVTQLGRIPHPAGMLWWNGQADLLTPTFYKAALIRVLDGLEDEFASRVKGAARVPCVLMRMGANTPAGTDEQVAAILAAQQEIAAERDNCVLVNTDALPLQSANIWPRTTRKHNGIHLTARGSIMSGYLADEAFGTFASIPAHPDGAAAVDYGTDGSSAIIESASAFYRSAEAEEVTATVAEDTPAASTLVSASALQATAAEVIAAIDAAILDGGDVSSYTVNGRTVQLRSLSELLAVRRYYEAQQARASGVRYTRVSF